MCPNYDKKNVHILKFLICDKIDNCVSIPFKQILYCTYQYGMNRVTKLWYPNSFQRYWEKTHFLCDFYYALLLQITFFQIGQYKFCDTVPSSGDRSLMCLKPRENHITNNKTIPSQKLHKIGKSVL